MKSAVILLVTIFFIPIFTYSQTTETFDYVSPFHEGYAAVKKGNQWGFINTNGNLVINFRDDLVTTKVKSSAYPVFAENRCLIVKKEKGISYFGFIDNSGKIVIKPVFLNATNFSNDVAIAIAIQKEKTGYNNVLKKDIVYYTSLEILIDDKGEIKSKLSEPKNIVLSKKNLPAPPEITSKLLSKKLIVIKDESKKWKVKKYE